MPLLKADCPWNVRIAVLGVLFAAPITTRAESADPVQAESVTADRAARSGGATIGFVASVGPAYAGGDRVSSTLQPGFALRWGRVSLASRSAFAVRSADPGARGGLRVELARGERLRASLGLRADSGRQASSSDRLAGMGDVRRTLRARLSASYRLDDGWRLGSAVMVDALRRGTGTVVDLTFGREQRLSERTSSSYAVALSGGDSHYLQAYFGVTAEQAQRSGYAVYTPGAGLRDISLSIGARTELAPQWAVFYGASASRLLAASARSPLTFKRNGWGLSGGLVYRF